MVGYESSFAAGMRGVMWVAMAAVVGFVVWVCWGAPLVWMLALLALAAVCGAAGSGWLFVTWAALFLGMPLCLLAGVLSRALA